MNGTALQSQREVIYEFARIVTLEGWWLWTLVIGSLIALLFVSVRYYRKDVSELAAPIRWSLIGLRIATILALVFFFLNLQRRTQRMVTRPSEVAVLVNASQSMSLPSDSNTGVDSRSDRVRKLLSDTNLLEQLGTEHQVSVYAFGDQPEPRLIDSLGGQQSDEAEAEATVPEGGLSIVAALGAFLILIAALLGLISLVMGASGNQANVGWWVLGCVATLIPGIVCLGSVYSVRTEQSLVQILGISPTDAANEPKDGETEDVTPENQRREVDWGQEIAASAAQSRIGDAIRSTLTSHDPATLAGIVLATDGQSNGGIDVNAAVSTARRVEVALYPVGLGSSDAPINVRVVDLDAPRRVYPGDNFVVTRCLARQWPKSDRCRSATARRTGSILQWNRGSRFRWADPAAGRCCRITTSPGKERWNIDRNSV